MRHLEETQRAYVSELVAMLRPGADTSKDVLDSRLSVVLYLRTRPGVDADLLLIGNSFSDPLPIHCLLMARSGLRLADQNRVCRIRGQVYEWESPQKILVIGVVLRRLHVANLFGSPVETRTRRSTDI